MNDSAKLSQASSCPINPFFEASSQSCTKWSNHSVETAVQQKYHLPLCYKKVFLPQIHHSLHKKSIHWDNPDDPIQKWRTGLEQHKKIRQLNIFFFLCASVWLIFTNLYLNSLILSSIVINQLLIPSDDFYFFNLRFIMIYKSHFKNISPSNHVEISMQKVCKTKHTLNIFK